MNRTLALLAVIAIGRSSASQAEPPPEPQPTVITLRPAAEPLPALKYRLVPERRSLVPGNAAVFYHRAIQLVEIQTRSAVTGKEKPQASSPSMDDQVADWISRPIAEVPRDEVRKRLELFSQALKEVELGAGRSSCDWEFDLRTEGYSLLLPEIQQMRPLARLVALRARLATLDGNVEEAMHWIETGLVLGRHVGHGPIVIQALVGIAIDHRMRQCLEDLIQSRGTPSLYWALADRPRPFIDMRYPMEGERYLLEKELPGLNELDQGPWGLDQARRFSEQLQRKLLDLATGVSIPGSNLAVPQNLPVIARQLSIAAITAKIYPEAKAALVAQGRPVAEVGAMPVVQVAALYSFQEYQRIRDESDKWMNVPYWQSIGRIDGPLSATVEQKLANPLLTLFSMLNPSRSAAQLASIRLDRQLDAIQCIEAIRLYAAAHEGKLPESLDAITDAPVPIDRATGKPFHYKRDGDSVTLSAPVPPGGPNHLSYAILYLLKLAR